MSCMKTQYIILDFTRNILITFVDFGNDIFFQQNIFRFIDLFQTTCVKQILFSI